MRKARGRERRILGAMRAFYDRHIDPLCLCHVFPVVMDVKQGLLSLVRRVGGELLG